MNDRAKLDVTHRAILDLQQEMRSDARFEALCRSHGLPWDFRSGYEPRWYGGPPPGEVKVLFFMAEPGAITPTEAQHLLPAINHTNWIQYDLSLQEHYWRRNLFELCRCIWPTDTVASMHESLGGSCTFWMSLPPGVQTGTVPAPLVKYFSRTYLTRLIELFPRAVVLAAGAKAHHRLDAIGIPHEQCWAFTRPGCNRPEARESWLRAGRAIAITLNARRRDLAGRE